jgi:hypothetical protein
MLRCHRVILTAIPLLYFSTNGRAEDTTVLINPRTSDGFLADYCIRAGGSAGASICDDNAANLAANRVCMEQGFKGAVKIAPDNFVRHIIRPIDEPKDAIFSCYLPYTECQSPQWYPQQPGGYIEKVTCIKK